MAYKILTGKCPQELKESKPNSMAHVYNPSYLEAEIWTVEVLGQQVKNILETPSQPIENWSW
jgi:hypothetical protein